MKTKNNIILNNTQINHKIRRIALQILESNINEKEIVLAGISKNGFLIAEKLKKIITHYSDVNIILSKVTINKHNLLSEVTTTLQVSDYSNKSIILVDDVLYSIDQCIIHTRYNDAATMLVETIDMLLVVGLMRRFDN